MADAHPALIPALQNPPGLQRGEIPGESLLVSHQEGNPAHKPALEGRKNSWLLRGKIILVTVRLGGGDANDKS